MFKCCLQETIAKSSFIEYFSEFAGVLEFWVFCGVSLAHLVLEVQLRVLVDSHPAWHG